VSTSRTVLVFAVMALVAVVLAVASLRVGRSPGELADGRPSPEAGSAVGDPGGPPSAGSGEGSAVRPLATADVGAGDPATADGASDGSGPEEDPDTPRRGIGAGEPPTWDDIERSYDALTKVSLQIETDSDDVRKQDLEASVRLRQKKMALQAFADLVDEGLDAVTIGRGDAVRRIDDARRHMIAAIDDAPVPSHVDDPEVWRANTTEQALQVLDGLSPQELDELGE